MFGRVFGVLAEDVQQHVAFLGGARLDEETGIPRAEKPRRRFPRRVALRDDAQGGGARDETLDAAESRSQLRVRRRRSRWRRNPRKTRGDGDGTNPTPVAPRRRRDRRRDRRRGRRRVRRGSTRAASARSAAVSPSSSTPSLSRSLSDADIAPPPLERRGRSSPSVPSPSRSTPSDRPPREGSRPDPLPAPTGSSANDAW